MSAAPMTDAKLAKLVPLIAAELRTGLARQIADELAPRIAEELSARAAQPADRAQPTCLLDATEFAARLGVKRTWVYRHAAELGAVKLGDGRRARLRFDPEKLSELATARSENSDSPSPPAQRRRGSRSPRPGFTAAGHPLLPVPAYDEADN